MSQTQSPSRTLISQNLKEMQDPPAGDSHPPKIPEFQEELKVEKKKVLEETYTLNGHSLKFKRMFQANAAGLPQKRDEDVLNGAILGLENAFGFQNVPIFKNSQFISEDTIVFPIGRHLATLDLVSQKMDFIRRDEHYASQITCMAVGSSRKKEVVIGIGEKTQNGIPKASIYIPQRLRWFKLEHDAEVLPEITEYSRIEQIILPNARKFCITVTKSSEASNLVVAFFRYEKEKLSRVSEVKSQIRKIAANPKNHYQFLACGKSYLKMIDASDKVFKEVKEYMIPQKYERDNDFLDVVYIQDTTFVTVSAQNNFFIVDQCQVKYYIAINFNVKNSLRNISQPSGKDGEGNEQKFEEDGTNAQVTCIAAHKKGFVVGSNKGGFLGIYEIERDYTINHIDTFRVDQQCTEVTCLSISLDRSNLILNAKFREEGQLPLATSSQQSPLLQDQIEYDSFEKLEMYQLNLHQLSVLKNVFTLPIKNVFPKGNLSGAILDLSVGISKDIIVTVGLDRYIRVFEYCGSSHALEGPAFQVNNPAGALASSPQMQFNQVSCHKSKEHPMCVATHPMGLQMAAGFKEKIKVYYLLEDEAKIAIDFPSKVCQCLAYSYGGQSLAVANGSVIQIIDTYTFELKFQLFGHPSYVRILKWNESDSMLLSVCNNGSAYGWNANFEIYDKDKNSKKKSQDHEGGVANKVEFIMKGVRIHAVAYDEEYDLLVVSTSDNRLNLFTTDSGRGCKNYMSIPTGEGVEVTSLLLAKAQSVLIAGTNLGSTRVYLWPMLKRKSNASMMGVIQDHVAGGLAQEQHVEFMEYFVHLGKVAQLQLSSDRQSLVSASDDGSIFIQSIKEMCNGIDMNLNVQLLASSSSQAHQEIMQKKKKNQLLNKCKVYLNMNQLSLVFKHAIESKNRQLQELKYKVENLKSYFQEELQNIANEKTQEITRLNEKNAKELEEEKQRYKNLQEEHENERTYLLKTIENNLESHKKELKEINDDYQLKLKNAYKQHDKLVEAYEESKLSYKEELESILVKNKEALEQIRKEYNNKYEELQKNHIRLINDMKRDGEKFDVALEQCEQEYEKELLKRRDDFAGQMSKITRQYEELRENHEKLQREKDTLQKKLGDCEEIQFKLGQEQEQFHNKIINSETRLVKMQEQLGEREEVIKHKEKNIKDLRNINTHLENFRFVLDHKIRSLKDEKLPMEAQIKNLEKHIKQMYTELLEECDKKKELINKLKEAENKLAVLNDQLKKQKTEVFFTKRKLDNLQYDLGNLIRNETLTDWPKMVTKLYSDHFERKPGQKEDIKSPERDSETIKKQETIQDEEEYNIKEELIKQNNWMNSKLKSIQDKNNKLEREKRDLYLRIQKENTELIKECNMLRTNNQKISKKVLVLEKKLKDISGISLSNANLVENQLEGFLKKAAPLTQKNKETPFMQLKKQSQNPNKRNQMLMDYYNQYASPTNATGGENMDGILNEMERNQNQIAMQNFEIQQLQERVTQFLRDPKEESKQALPPISSGMQKSESQPVLGGVLGLNKKDDSSSRFDTQSNSQIQIAVVESQLKINNNNSTMSQSNLMANQPSQVRGQGMSVGKDQKQKQSEL